MRDVRVDSTGIGNLVEHYAKAQEFGGAMCLCNMSQRMLDQFRVTKLLAVFEVFPDEEAAVATLKNRRITVPAAAVT